MLDKVLSLYSYLETIRYKTESLPEGAREYHLYDLLPTTYWGVTL
jgi:hypothetical protein